MRACEKTTQTVRKYTSFLQCFRVIFFTKVCILNKGRDKTWTFLTKTYLLPPKKASRMAITIGNVVKSHKINVLVKPAKEYKAKPKGKKCVFAGFWGKVYARAKVKHTSYFERPKRKN